MKENPQGLADCLSIKVSIKTKKQKTKKRSVNSSLPQIKNFDLKLNSEAILKSFF